MTEKEEDIEEMMEGELGLNIEEEANLDSEDTSNEVYPIAEVRIEKAQFSISELFNQVEKRKTLIIDPDFQRNSVWKGKQAPELVESILMGIPIPNMYLFEQKDGKRQVIDGRQRITTLISFLKNEFALKNLKILKGKEFEDKKFEDLDEKYQIKFEDYQLFFYIIQPPTSERIKYDIFDRVNRGGTKLNNQEMRNALYQGKATKLLKELSQQPEFLAATDHGLKAEPDRMKDRYVILRLISFYILRNQQYNKENIDYKSDLEDFLAKSMIYINEKMPDEDIERIKQLFIRAMDNISQVVGRDAFRFAPSAESKQHRRPINMLLFEALGYIFMTAEEKGWDMSSLNFTQIKADFDVTGYFNGKNDSKDNINKRYNYILQQIGKQ